MPPGMWDGKGFHQVALVALYVWWWVILYCLKFLASVDVRKTPYETIIQGGCEQALLFCKIAMGSQKSKVVTNGDLESRHYGAPNVLGRGMRMSASVSQIHNGLSSRNVSVTLRIIKYLKAAPSSDEPAPRHEAVAQTRLREFERASIVLCRFLSSLVVFLSFF
jgi:hypothetical protein